MRVGVIMGGVSSEKQVSLMTGEEMIAHLGKDKYKVMPIKLNNKKELIEKAKDLDIALLALHGQYGEDGTIQGTLET
ncbi:D-alanine--D-alanine ligase, partial [Priestia megaterium]